MGCQLAQLVSPFFGVLFNVVILTSVLQVRGVSSWSKSRA